MLVEEERSIESNTNLNTRRQYSRSLSNSVAKIDVGSLRSEEIEKKMKELYNKIDGAWKCLACDYTTSRNSGGNIRRHVETHIEGLSYTCTLCSKEFRLKDSLNCHMSRSHRK